MIFMQFLLQIKQDIYQIGIFRAPVVTQFIVKGIFFFKKKSHFLKVYHFSISQHFTIVLCVSHASSDHIIYTMHNKFSNYCFVWVSQSTSDLKFHLLS